MVEALAPLLACSGVLPRKLSFTPAGARIVAQEAARAVGEQASGAPHGRGPPVPVGSAASASTRAQLSRHPRGVSFQISRCG